MESTNITHTSFKDTCRVCLAKNGALVDIFRCQNRNIPEEIHYCSGVLINVSDNLPPNICVACLKELSVACNFKRKCLKADEVFRQVLVVEQVEYLEDYFQATEQEPGSSIYVADIDKENTEIFSSLEDKVLSNKDGLQKHEKVHSQDKQIYACDECPSKYSHIANYWHHMKVKHGGQSKGNKHFSTKSKPSLKIEFAVINSSEQLSNTLIKEIHSEINTEEITETVEDNFNSDYLTDNENSDHSLRDDKNSKTEGTTERNSTLNTKEVHKGTNIEDVEVRDDRNLKIKDITEQISTLTMPKEVRIVLQDALIRDYKTPKRKEITEQNSNFITVQKIKNIEMQDVGNVKGVLKKYKTKDITSISTRKINKTAEITEQTSTLKTVQNITNIKVQDVKNLKDRLNIHKRNDVPFEGTPKVNTHGRCTKCDIRFNDSKEYFKHRRKVHHENPITCKICNKQLSNRNSYKNHLRLHEISPPQYICNLCGFKTKHKCYLKRHYNIHSGDIKYTCDYCKKVFLEKSNLIEHITVIHLKNLKYSCSICHINFHSKKYLNKHLKIHFRETPAKIRPIIKIDKIEQTIEDIPKISNTEEITDQLRTLITVQKSKNIKMQDDENVKGVLKNYKTKDLTSISTRKINKTAEITEQTSTLKTVQKLTKIKVQDVKNLKDRLNIHKRNDVPFEGTPKFNTHGRCMKCDIRFNDSKEYYRHRRTVHHDNPITCKICNKQLSNRNSYKNHLRLHEISPPQYICNLCGFKTNHKCNLKRHHNIHSGDLKYTCDYCKKVFLEKTNLIKHITVIHLKNFKYSCTICHRNFHSKRYLTKHLKIHFRETPAKKRPIIKIVKREQTTEDIPKISNTEEITEHPSTLETVQKRTKTEICDRIDQIRDSHRYTAHETLYTCEICGKQHNSSRMKEHMVTHTGARYFGDVCEFKTAHMKHMKKHAPGELKKHPREVHEEKHVCEICGKQFGSSATLSQHRQFHMVPKMICDVCGYKTVRKTDLIKHMTIHSGNKFTCEHCKRDFNFRQNLFVHTRRMHLKNLLKKYKCTTCEKRFYLKCELVNHFRGHIGAKRYTFLRKLRERMNMKFDTVKVCMVKK